MFEFTQPATLPKELDLDGAEVTFAQPANALLLRMRLDGFKLVRHWGGTQLVVGDRKRCRVRVYPGPAEVVEQSFAEPPEMKQPSQQERDARRRRHQVWLEQMFAKGTASPSEQARKVQEALVEFDRTLAMVTTTEWSMRGAFPSKARISGQTQLVFRLRQDVDPGFLQHLSLDLTKLLDARAWQLVIVRDAASSEAVRATAGFAPQVRKDAPPSDATSIEAPSSLYLSPDETVRISFQGLGLRKGGSHDLFRLLAEGSQARVPLRAIGTVGFDESATVLPPHYAPSTGTPEPPNVFRKPLDFRDRAELVWLTSQWDRAALAGTRDVRERRANEVPLAYAKGFEGVYVPRALGADLLMFTSMGAYLRSSGDWDPPALRDFALSVERWEHSSTLAARRALPRICDNHTH